MLPSSPVLTRSLLSIIKLIEAEMPVVFQARTDVPGFGPVWMCNPSPHRILIVWANMFGQTVEVRGHKQAHPRKMRLVEIAPSCGVVYVQGSSYGASAKTRNYVHRHNPWTIRHVIDYVTWTRDKNKTKISLDVSSNV